MLPPLGGGEKAAVPSGGRCVAERPNVVRFDGLWTNDGGPMNTPNRLSFRIPTLVEGDAEGTLAIIALVVLVVVTLIFVARGLGWWGGQSTNGKSR